MLGLRTADPALVYLNAVVQGDGRGIRTPPENNMWPVPRNRDAPTPKREVCLSRLMSAEDDEFQLAIADFRLSVSRGGLPSLRIEKQKPVDI